MGFFKKWMGKLFGSQQESFSQKTSKVIEKVKVRARDAKGRFMKDDPSTPENEAWTEKERVARQGLMVKLYLFTMSFYTLLASYDTMMECTRVASLIHEDYRYDPNIKFSLYCMKVEIDEEELLTKGGSGGMARKIIEQQYIYKAEVDRVVDGDTVDVLLDLSFGVYRKVRIRANGIDTLSHAQETRQRKSWVWLQRNE